MRKLLSVLFLSLFVLQINAQCPFEKGDCKGECRRFVDKDGDGFCDLGFVTETFAEVDADLPDSDISSFPVNMPEPVEPDERIVESIVEITVCELPVNLPVDWTLISDTMFGNPAIVEVDDSQNKQVHEKNYDLVLITFLTIGLYALSVLLVACKNITKATHRKLWNWILLISFLVSGILGLILVWQIDYDIGKSLFRDFLFLHVEFGIVMAIVSLIHVFWHVNYYLNTFGSMSKPVGGLIGIIYAFIMDITD